MSPVGADHTERYTLKAHDADPTPGLKPVTKSPAFSRGLPDFDHFASSLGSPSLTHEPTLREKHNRMTQED